MARGDLDEIPVEELIRITREFTRRVTNQDRQRETLNLRASGHHRSVQTSAPIVLQQFFAGEIDLDADLARRFAHAPLLSHVRFEPAPGEPIRRQASAVFSTNDSATTLTIDAPPARAGETSLEVTFTLYSALGLRFRLAPLLDGDRHEWLALLRRESGITFVWTRQRWEQPYLIFVVREYFARLYAFAPAGMEAAARLTPTSLAALVEWLELLWFPQSASEARQESFAAPLTAPQTSPAEEGW